MQLISKSTLLRNCPLKISLIYRKQRDQFHPRC